MKTMAWQFDPDTDATNALDAGAMPTEALTVTASDGTATSAAKTITIDITERMTSRDSWKIFHRRR